MKQIRNWKIGPNPPDIQSGWIYRGVARYFNNGKWEVIGGYIPDPDEPSNMLEVPVTQEQLSALLGGQTVIVPDANINALYGTIKLKVDTYSYFLHKSIGSTESAKYSTGNIFTNDGTMKLSTLDGIVSSGVITLKINHVNVDSDIIALEIGNSAKTKEYNMSVLRTGFFQVQLDYGYGVGTWTSTQGGFAHVTTAYGDEVFYNITVDGAVTKQEDYIKPNLPYTLELDSDQIGSPVDAVTATNLLRCGEIIIKGPTGPITYTRSVDSTPTAIYFTSSKKDDTLQVLTYTVSNQTIQASIAIPKITPAEKVDVLASSSDLTALVNSFNDLVAKLQAAGIMKT